MKGLLKISFILIFIIINNHSPVFAQGKYFEVKLDRNTSGSSLYAAVVPVNNQKDITLKYPGKTKAELDTLTMRYLKTRPTMVYKNGMSTDALITYRDFSMIGKKDSCFADLIGLTYVYVIPEEGQLRVSLGKGSEIFATIFDAKLKITIDDKIASDNDLPFNEYRFVQPKDETYLLTKKTVFSKGSETRSLKEAYPDSVFSPEGQVVNARNKRFIENYYDSYVEDLNNYVSKN